jgi:hypothetical protein
MTPMAKKKAEDALTTTVRNSTLGYVSRQELIESRIAEGFRPVTAGDGSRRLQNSNGVYLTERAITTTGMRYAEFLVKQQRPKPAPSVLTNPGREDPGLATIRQPAAKGLATPGAAAGPRPGSVAAAMRASIETMRQLDVQQMSRMANDLFESKWTVERNRQWKKLSKEEAKAQFIAKMGQDMQAERAKIAQQSTAAAAAGNGQAKSGSVAAAMRANIEAMKASDRRMAELDRRVVDLRRKTMALELGDLPDELPQAAPPARRRRQLPKG